ncbi:hypothetical protein J2067_001949 [Erwinia rhapontici]|nr:hypothetical protein [Erwinia rhapontici]
MKNLPHSTRRATDTYRETYTNTGMGIIDAST